MVCSVSALVFNIHAMLPRPAYFLKSSHSNFERKKKIMVSLRKTSSKLMTANMYYYFLNPCLCDKLLSNNSNSNFLSEEMFQLFKFFLTCF